MDEEYNKIKLLFEKLQEQEKRSFPEQGGILSVSTKQGVYVIRNSNGRVVHVGRTLRGKNGLSQRLQNHLNGQSSFVKNFLRDKNLLRNRYTFQYLEVSNDRQRLLLEYFATVRHCPEHLGLGSKKES